MSAERPPAPNCRAATEDRIRKLLAKSNGGSAAEYATAMRIAVRLANQHGIDLATMAGDKAPKWTNAESPAIIIESKARAPKWERYLVQGLAEHLGCFAYSVGRRNAAGVLMTAQVAHGELGRVQTLRTLAQIWTKEAVLRASCDGKKAAFIVGFVSTVLARLSEASGVVSEPGAMVPVDLAERARNEVEAAAGRMRSVMTRVDREAYGRGASAAEGATMPGQAAALRGRLAPKA